MERYMPARAAENITSTSREKLDLLYDSVWGECAFGDRYGDELLREILSSDAAKRLKNVEQLTFAEPYAIRPNTYNFSRKEHVVGSMVMVRKLWDKEAAQNPDDFTDERQLLILQLRTLLSDFGHTLGSHVGDMVFAGFDGKEDFHDETLKSFLTRTGITALLSRHDVSLNEAVFPDVQDWVECDSPKLCVDRVDYALREIRRWVAEDDADFTHHPLDRFELAKVGDTYQMVVNDEVFARKFARAYAVIAREHWGNPAQMLQMKLYVDLIRHVLAAQPNHPHPHDVMYGTERTMQELILRQEQKGDTYTTQVVELMKRNASCERERWEILKPEFIAFVNGKQDDWPELSHAFARSPYLDLSMGQSAELVTMEMPLAKPRRIDPLVITKQGYVSTSDMDDWLKSFGTTIQPPRTLTIAVEGGMPSLPEPERWMQALERHRMSDHAVQRALARLAI